MAQYRRNGRIVSPRPVDYRYSNDKKEVKVSCVGCLISIILLVIAAWVLTHVTEIFAFLDRLVGA